MFNFCVLESDALSFQSTLKKLEVNKKLKWEEKVEKLELVEFNKDSAIASLDSGQPVIPLWLERIQAKLQ